MPYFTQLGTIPRKRHVAFRQPDGTLYSEEIIGEDGFSGDTSLLYHRYPPSALTSIEAVKTPDEGLHPNEPLSPIHLKPRNLSLKGDAVLDRVILLANDDVRIGYAVASEDSSLYKNATGDELAYVESGSGALESTFGRIEITEGDYVIVPTSTIHRWTVKGDESYGLAATDVEGLTKLGADVQFAYIGSDGDKNSTPFAGVLAKDKVWTSLPFVKKGDVHRLPDGIWMFGGPESMGKYVDSAVAALTK